MNKLHLTMAATLALGAGLAGAQAALPLEGGQAAGPFPPGAARFTSNADRSTVAAEGREAARRVNSRSGYQDDAERGLAPSPYGGSTRARSDVRAEARSTLREANMQVFEGGQAGPVRALGDADGRGRSR